MFKPKGFTLTELVVVIITVAILAGIALPQYQKTIELAKNEDAKVAMRMICAAEKLYRANYGNWYMPSGGQGTQGLYDDINAKLHLNLHYDGLWQYVVFVSAEAPPVNWMHIFGYRQGSDSRILEAWEDQPYYCEDVYCVGGAYCGDMPANP